MTHKGRILFIQPEEPPGRRIGGTLFSRLWQPLDLANCAGILGKEGYFVRVLDNRIAHLKGDRLARFCAPFDKIVVTSAAFDRWQCPPLEILPFFHTAAALVKDRLCIMGPHVTERPETFLRETGARFAVLGEPERTVCRLVKADWRGNECHGFPGIAWLGSDGSFHRGKADLTPAFSMGWPTPALHLLSMERYHYPLMARPFTLLEGSRGCPFTCRFCYKGMHPGTYIQKNPETLANEALWVKQRFGISQIYFMDLEFGLKRSWLERFCLALIRRKAKVSWCCQTRVSDVDQGLLDLMAASGCSLIHFGAESGSQRVLDWTGKGIKRSDCEQAVAHARKAGIRSAVFFNLGFPGETGDEMEDTVRWALALSPDYVSFHRVMPVPGSALQKEAGVDPEALPCHRYPAYIPGQDAEIIVKKLHKAYLRFYLHPQNMLKAFRHHGVGNLNTLKLFLQTMKGI